MTAEMSGLRGCRLPLVSELLLPVSGAARRARDVVTQACAQWELPHLTLSASLVATELVTNVVVHAHTMANLHVVRGRRYLIVLVFDGSQAVPVMHPRQTFAAEPDGPAVSRGLILVDAVAAGWGCRRGEGGKAVWAALRM